MAEAEPDRTFLRGLSPPQRETFDAAARLLEERGDGLGWHHDLGTRLALLAGGERGSGRAARLARALGLSRVGVYQHVQFVERYPSREEAEALGRGGLRWAMAVALLAVPDDAERSRLQREAVRQRWSVDRLRLEARKLRPSPRRKPPEGRPSSPEVGPELGRLDDATASWLAAHRELQDAGDDALAPPGRDEGEEGRALLRRLEALELALDQMTRDAVSLRWRLRERLVRTAGKD